MKTDTEIISDLRKERIQLTQICVDLQEKNKGDVLAEDLLKQIDVLKSELLIEKENKERTLEMVKSLQTFLTRE